MSNIPEDIKQNISDKAEIECRSLAFSGGFKKNMDIRFGFNGGGLYGYSLALPKIEELNNVITNLMKQMKNDAVVIAEQAKEIERLKNKIEDDVEWHRRSAGI